MSEYDRLRNLAKELRGKYPPGTRLELISMEEEFSPVEAGTRGTVHFIDDIGQIHMLWDNTRTLFPLFPLTFAVCICAWST